jgi:hypothetical protein
MPGCARSMPARAAHQSGLPVDAAEMPTLAIKPGDQLSIGSAARKRGRIKRCQHRIEIAAPRLRIGIDPPVIRHLTDGSENRMRIENSGCARAAGVVSGVRGSRGLLVAIFLIS